MGPLPGLMIKIFAPTLFILMQLKSPTSLLENCILFFDSNGIIFDSLFLLAITKVFRNVEDDEEKVMVVRTIVAVIFLVVCAVVMHKMFWMLEQCVPMTQEAKSKARARRWKGAVAAVVAGAWICAICIAFVFDMSKAMREVVFAGPIVITIPVLVWVFLVY